MPSYITKTQLADRIVAAKKALDALNAKNKSLKLTKHSTAMKIPLIETFQKIEGTLKVDGLYGPNAKAAITWYLQTYPKPQTIPAVNPSFAKTALTWKAPALEPATAAKPTPTPAPATPKVDVSTLPTSLPPKVDVSTLPTSLPPKASSSSSSSKTASAKSTTTKASDDAKTKAFLKAQAEDAEKKKQAAEDAAKKKKAADELAKKAAEDAAKKKKAAEDAAKKKKAAEEAAKKKKQTTLEDSDKKPPFFATTAGKITAGVGALAFIAGLAVYSK